MFLRTGFLFYFMKTLNTMNVLSKKEIEGMTGLMNVLSKEGMTELMKGPKLEPFSL